MYFDITVQKNILFYALVFKRRNIGGKYQNMK